MKAIILTIAMFLIFSFGLLANDTIYIRCVDILESQILSFKTKIKYIDSNDSVFVNTKANDPYILFFSFMDTKKPFFLISFEDGKTVTIMLEGNCNLNVKPTKS